MPGASANPERFPRRMRDKPRWIGWKWGAKRKGGGWTYFNPSDLEPYDGHLWHVDGSGNRTRAEKLPVCVATMRAASVSDPSTWRTFGEVMDAFGRGHVHGVGYVLDAGEVLMDVDGCMQDGEPNLFARTCIGELDSYAERSVSGEGIHILCVADGFKPDRGCKAARCEIYVGGHTKRYCTVSGDVLEGCEELNDDAEDVLTGIYQSEFEDRPIISTEAYERAAKSLELLHEAEWVPEDGRIVAWVCGHFRWGRPMFERGDYSGWAEDRARYQPNKDRSRSEADAALASYLLAGAEGDAGTAWTLLNASAMWRPKYDEIHDGRRLYSVMTIAKVKSVVDVAKMRSDAFRRRDERLAEYPSRLGGLAELMKRDDVTESMLRHVMATRATGAARRNERQGVTTYPQSLIDWIIERWPQVVELAYTYDLGREVRP